MAEEQDYSGYGVTGYIPITKWNYVPFYKKYTFTGVSQTDQAANLITSPSFTSFWSGGGSQADLTTGMRLDSETRDVHLAKQLRSRDIDYTPNIPKKPTLPTPPPHIRPIKLDTWGYPLTQNPLKGLGEHLGLGLETAQEAFEHGMFVPAKHGDIWPLMTAEEQAWWHQKVRGIGEGLNYNNQVSNWQAAKSATHSVPIELRNIPSALPRNERMLVNTLHYGMDAGVAPYLIANPNQRHADLKNFRLVNASDPSNLSGVSQELGDYAGYGPNRSRGRYVPSDARHKTGIMLVSSSNPELPLNLRESRRVLAEAGQMRLENKAIIETGSYLEKIDDVPKARPVHKINNLHIGGPLPQTPLDDIPPVVRDEFNVGAERYREGARRVGTITTDAAKNTTMNVYGPPDKYAQWRARGMQALNVGGKILLGAGIVGETMNTPSRLQQYYMNALKEDPNWRPDISDKIGMSFAAGVENAINFGTMGFYDQRERIFNDMTAGAGYGKGYYGTMTPPAGTTSVHYNPQSRYERTGVSFNHLYPKAP